MSAVYFSELFYDKFDKLIKAIEDSNAINREMLELKKKELYKSDNLIKSNNIIRARKSSINMRPPRKEE